MLVQDSDAEIEDRGGWQVVTGELDEPRWGDLVFAWRVCKHVASNAIVLAKDLQTIGIGAGQMSRVDAVRIAVEKAAEFGHDVAGSALASDAFFPFPDGPQIALDAGTTAIVQPGGSRRDADVIAVVAAAGAAMVTTGGATSATRVDLGVGRSSPYDGPRPLGRSSDGSCTDDGRTRSAPLEGAHRRLCRLLHDDLDVSIVNVALPSIGTSLDFSPDNLQWVITAYAITIRRLPPARRAPRRPLRPPAGLHDRGRHLHGRFALLRPRRGRRAS
jgi:hypothetical protein